MRGLLQRWGCRLVTAATESDLIANLAGVGRTPDLIIADYHLSNQITGIAAIRRLRSACHTPIPAFLITGDTAPELVREASTNGIHLLHKPVSPMALRAMLNQLLKSSCTDRQSQPIASL
jgi:CheY-like chemotaxis protein